MKRTTVSCLKPLSVIIFTAALAACSSEVKEEASVSTNNSSDINASVEKAPANPAQDIIKSANDDRDYQLVTLDNGVRVVLISDPDADKAAASIYVGTGSWSDPKGREGMAHFLEHMLLFMKSEKYPELGGFREYVKAQGGSMNGTTYGEKTNYYFEVNAEGLAEGLDRLAWAVGKSILENEYVDKERNSVDSEFRAGFTRPYWRSNVVHGETSNPAHPYGHFGTGNIDTLNNDDGVSLLKDLEVFYRDYYVGSNMTVAVYGQESLAELETMAKTSLAAIPAGVAAEKPWDDSISPFTEGQQGVQINIKTLQDRNTLSLEFNLPASRENFAAKPVVYLKKIFSSERKGTLYSALKEEGLINSLSAYGWDSDNSFTDFGISMGLTEKGAQQTDRIGAIVFDFIDLVKKDGIKKELFDEYGQIARLFFDSADQARPVDHVNELAYNLQEYPVKNLLNVDVAWERYDEALIRSYLNEMTVDNLRMIVSGKDVSVDKEAPHYGTRYSMAPLTETQQQLFADSAIHSSLSLPALNPYAPKNLELIAENEQSKEVPSQLINEPGLRVWHKSDQTFNAPKADVRLAYSTPLSDSSVKNSVTFTLFSELIGQVLNEPLYPAREAGLGYSVYRQGTTDLAIQLSGFSDKQPLLLDTIVKALEEQAFTEQDFARVKEAYAKNLENFRLSSPDDQAWSAFNEVVFPGTYSAVEQAEALKAVSLADVQAFGEAFLKKAHLDVLVHGNLSAAQTESMARKAAAVVKEPGEHYRTRLYDLSSMPTVSLALDIDHSDSTSFLYYQAQDESLETRTGLALIDDMISGPYFRELRTNQQLGYIVWSSPRRLNDRPGLVFMVQSTNTAPEEIKKRSLALFAQQREVIEAMDAQAFADLKETLIKDTMKKDTGLTKRTNRFWWNIVGEKLDFADRDHFVAAAKLLTKEKVLALYDKYLLADGALSLEVKSFGKNHKAEKPDASVENVVKCATAECLDAMDVPTT
ncbi:insulinase family protein [Parendozoicomonas haliclonae]|uniref:Protease 3 n=1 Tax=Parendozoicomonas haliclonae TaxID=1960125 RepID=A0A1X7AI70_9GAMM|nr:insulinase family protein [Parendozoicomonas haliclonae]SMA44249.1 Protease 3 precursor [Parendozoicomonas haliclonae]